MKKLMLFLALLSLFGLAQTMPTDGNYVMLNFDLVGTNEDTFDANYTMFVDVGEPTVIQGAEDYNQGYSMGAGFWGEPIISIIRFIAVPARVIFLVLAMPSQNPSYLGFGGLAVVVLAVILLKKKGKDTDE